MIILGINKEPIQSTLFKNKTKESNLSAGSSISSLWLDPESDSSLVSLS